MNRTDLLAKAARHARQIKERHVRDVKGRPGYTDIPTAIEGFRGDDADPVVVVLHRVHRDIMLGLADVVIRGMGVDAIALNFEGYGVVAKTWEGGSTNPDTGQRWRDREMGVYFDKHGPDNGVVVEALVTTVVTRAGDAIMDSQSYRIEGTGVHWADDLPSEGRDLGVAGGYVTESLQQMMKAPTILQTALTMRPDFAGLPHEKLMVDSDLAALDQMPEMLGEDAEALIGAMLFAIPGSPRHQLLRERLDRSSVADPRAWN